MEAFVWATGIPFAGLWVWASLSTDPPKKAEPTREEIWTARNTYRACLIYHEGKGFLKAGLSCTHLQPEGADPQKVWEVRHTDRENRIGYSN